MKQQATIEYISQPKQKYATGQVPGTKKSSSRLKNFVVTFLFSLILGLIINFSRPAVYQSSATLLTSAATAVDEVSRDVDFQNVIIQRQKLLGYELLTETLSRIHSLENNSDLLMLKLSDIRTMLQVESIADTNLLSMQAEGPIPDVLPVVINSWIDVYLEARALSVKNSTNETVELIKSELAELENKIEQTRVELDLFRKEHDISSIVREENESPAKLKSLTTALNVANEEVVKSKAKLDAINAAISSGQAVVPKQEQTTLTELEKRYQQLTEKLAEFDDRYTRDYLQFHSSLKTIPEQIKKLEIEIRNRRSTGKSIVKTEASQEYFAARQVVTNIRKQLDEHKNLAANFTTLFSKHTKLVDDLESMELINRETRDRLVSLESKQFDKYPQVDVVERASLNMQSVRPDYIIGALIVLIISLLLAFFTVWLIEFLFHDQTSDQGSFEFPLAAWFRHTQYHENDAIAQQKNSTVIEQQGLHGLPHVRSYRKISDDDLDSLLNNSDSDTKQVILFLLSGLTLEEISALNVDEIDCKHSIIQLFGNASRSLLVGARLNSKLNEAIEGGLLWKKQQNVSVDELNAMLYCSAVDMGFNDLDNTLAERLRQTYIIYLVEQGIRLAALEQIVGYQSSLDLAGYAEFSPSGEGREIESVQLIHPVCCG